MKRVLKIWMVVVLTIITVNLIVFGLAHYWLAPSYQFWEAALHMGISTCLLTVVTAIAVFRTWKRG